MHQHVQEVGVVEEPGVGGAHPLLVLVALRVERPLVEDAAEGGVDPFTGAAEHGEEQVELGAEHADDVRLADPRLLGHGVGARARVSACRERAGRRLEDELAAFGGRHPDVHG